MIDPPSNNRDDNLHPSRWPVVPFVPFRCPSCGRHKPRTENVRGRLRMHVCQACGMRYRSIEVTADALPDWKYRPDDTDATT